MLVCCELMNTEGSIMKQFWDNNGLGTPHELEQNEFQSLLDVFDESCLKYQKNIAFSNMGSDLTYRELDQLSENFAAYLQSLPYLKKGDRVAIQLPNILQYPIASLGILKAGMIIVNTNPLYTEQEMLHQFQDSESKALIILSNMAHKAEAILSQTSIKKVIVTEVADLFVWPKKLAINFIVDKVQKMVPAFKLPKSISFNAALKKGWALEWTRPEINKEDIAALQYTGGTTGVSKGAILTHANIIANLLQNYQILKPYQRQDTPEIIITPLPLYHIFSFTCNLVGVIYSGNQSVLITNPRNVNTFVKMMKKYKFSAITAVNTLFVSLCEHKDFHKLDFSQLHLSIAGGMALTSDAAKKWEEITGCPILEGYGLTESSPVVTMNTKEVKKAGSIGKPLPGTLVKIIDDEGKDLPIGDQNTAGELCVKGPQVMAGYWQKPDETEKCMTADGWLQTGDIAKIDKQGFITIVDRKKDMILVSGFNIYPNELEDTLSAHPDVLECAAVGIPDKKSGETIKMFVVPKNKKLTTEDVMKWCRKALPHIKYPKISNLERSCQSPMSARS